jgi:hypothetical protein
MVSVWFARFCKHCRSSRSYSLQFAQPCSLPDGLAHKMTAWHFLQEPFAPAVADPGSGPNA